MGRLWRVVEREARDEEVFAIVGDESEVVFHGCCGYEHVWQPCRDPLASEGVL